MGSRLRLQYSGSFFSDPALYLWRTNTRQAMLFDCGDLSGFLTRQLLRVTHIFLSHCHIDHFYGFDHFLRIHMGYEKTVNIFGPPETSERVAGKLQGYTWNLAYDQNIRFVVQDLDEKAGARKTTSFFSRDKFKAKPESREEWSPADPVFGNGYIEVRTTTLDHRTPCLAYAVEERPWLKVNEAALEKSGFRPGAWIGELKRRYASREITGMMGIESDSGARRSLPVQDLIRDILLPEQAYKIVYVMDGAANQENAEKILSLAKDADILCQESCFLQKDAALAAETKHFTAEFVGKTAERAGVKKLVPLHFSKRYLENPQAVLEEIGRFFNGEISAPEGIRWAARDTQ